MSGALEALESLWGYLVDERHELMRAKVAWTGIGNCNRQAEAAIAVILLSVSTWPGPTLVEGGLPYVEADARFELMRLRVSIIRFG